MNQKMEQMAMSFQANVLKVMIASPGDVTEERAVVTEEIHRWNDAHATTRNLVVLPVKWETHSTPQMGGHPQTIIDHQILDDADILIAIFGTRIGTPTEEYVSGTVEEIKKHVAAGKTAKVYFSDVPVPPSVLNPMQYASVQKFREECQSTGLYATFNSLEQLRSDFARHLAIELNQPRYLWLAPPEIQARSGLSELSKDAIELVRAASESDQGVILTQETLDGSSVQAGEKTFGDGKPRSHARWRAAVESAVQVGALENISKDVYRLTAVGYELADKDGEAQSASQDIFNEQQNAHTKALTDPLTTVHRDLLRLLLLKGGSVRGDVLARASTNGMADTNINELVRPLEQSGLITRDEDGITGYSTFTVNSGLAEGLKRTLFPRDAKQDSDSRPFFTGI